MIEKYDIDHIKPVSVGGTNDRENLQALCKKCHETKSDVESGHRNFIIDATISACNEKSQVVFDEFKNGFIHTYIELDSVKSRVKNGRSFVFGIDGCKFRKTFKIW